MTTGTEGDDNLQNDEHHDVIDARGGNDVITIVAIPSAAPTTASVDGGTGFDILQASGGQMTATSIGQFSMRSGSSLHVFVQYTNVERLILSGRYVNTDPFLTGDTQDWLTFTGTGGARVIVQTNGGDDRVFLTGLHVGGDIDVGSGNDHVDLSGASPTNNPYFTINGGDGSDLLIGSSAPDTIDGGEGIDSLNGLGGADILRGGTGNDFYQVDTEDVVEELAGGGFDYVYARSSYTLPTNAEVEAMATTDTAGTSYLLLRGNGYNNAITGNAGDNSIDGLGGDDYLVGLEGNDRLDGGTGADFMVGGTGNDIYIVDNPFDEVRDYVGEGLDYLFTSTDYALRPGVEIELFATANYLETAPLFLTGNELNNAITGNNGNNQMSGEGGDDHITGLAGDDIMDGGTGVDTMTGGTGNDVYYVDNAGDVAV
ncbi:calcium-binding protein, partial [Allosphingosinicella sp.]|uniref:calcium-binding protein n=1 Tax=Allosphingosinicella sp. TaxID=2823234 RepID=UPI002F17767D